LNGVEFINAFQRHFSWHPAHGRKPTIFRRGGASHLQASNQDANPLIKYRAISVESECSKRITTMTNFSRMQLNWIIFESRLEGLNRHTFQTDGDFWTGIGDEHSTGKPALVTVSTEWTFRKPERNETDEQWSAVFETAIECVTG
jgi:hypothetical protein